MSGNALTSLLYFLAFGFVFYWMMKKAGCGMHSHGGHGAHGHRPEGGHDEHDEAGTHHHEEVPRRTPTEASPRELEHH